MKRILPAVTLTTDLTELELQNHDLLILECGRSGFHGHHLANLMALTDWKQHVEHYNGAVVLMCSGYDDDPRELCEIPEVTRYFADLTAEWPFWLHFICRTPLPDGTDAFANLMRILAPPKVHRRPGSNLVGFEYDFEAIQRALNKLYAGMFQLHASHDISPAVGKAIDKECAAALERMFS